VGKKVSDHLCEVVTKGETRAAKAGKNDGRDFQVGEYLKSERQQQRE